MGSFAKTDKRHFNARQSAHLFFILHIYRDLNTKHVLSKKPVLFTLKASSSGFTAEADKRLVIEQKQINPF